MDWFWSEAVWCPPHVKWTDFRPDSAQFNDLYYSVITAGVLIIMRKILESILFKPIGRHICAMPPSTTSSSSSSVAFKTGGDGFGKASSNHRANGSSRWVAKSSTVAKFSESMWRFSFYLTASIYGWCFVLWDKPYSKDTIYAIKEYPHHPVKSEEWWYYNLELGFYISLVVTQFMDTKRSDFWQMFVHHIVTILLLCFSWSCNFHRLGALVLAIHDIADVPMEAAKIAKYCKKQRLADFAFAIFTITWIYTRCYLLPTRVIYYTSYKALSIVPFFPAYFIFNGLLCLLQVLHLAWTWLIMRIVFYALQNDGMRDLRSDSEDSEELHND